MQYRLKPHSIRQLAGNAIIKYFDSVLNGSFDLRKNIPEKNNFTRLCLCLILQILSAWSERSKTKQVCTANNCAIKFSVVIVRIYSHAHFPLQVYFSFYLTLTPKTHFVQFYLKITSYFLSLGKTKYVTLRMGLLCNKMYIFCTESIVNLKLKFWSYNEKNMHFHSFDTKSTTSGWALGNKHAIGTSSLTLV